MSKKKVLVSGCNGKMGQLVCKAVDATDDMEVIAGFDQTFSVDQFPVYTTIDSLTVDNRDNKPDVIIDFSSPKATATIAEYACANGIPIVVATTGLTDDVMNYLRNMSTLTPVFQAANMSFDVELMRYVAQLVAKQLPDSDIEISETHHNRKADCPSGTAKMLADAINEAQGNTKTSVYGREGKREKNEIGLSSVRGGNIVGEHTVQFFGEHETFEIKHTTYSREVFAEGAVKAARFLMTKELGFYTMEDLVSSVK